MGHLRRFSNRFRALRRRRPAVNAAIEVGLEDASAVYRAVEPVIFALIEEMLDPQQPFRPTEELEQHCPRCPYTTLCGTQWVRGWEP